MNHHLLANRDLGGAIEYLEVSDDRVTVGAFDVLSRLVPHVGPTLGYRVVHDSGSVAYKHTTPVAAVLYKVSPTMNVYASAARGFDMEVGYHNHSAVPDSPYRYVDNVLELARWADPAYVRTQARERLGWVVPGETGYRVVDGDGNPLGGGAEIGSSRTMISEPQDAWWAKLWGSVEAADKPAPAKPKEKTITPQTETADGPR